MLLDVVQVDNKVTEEERVLVEKLIAMNRAKGNSFDILTHPDGKGVSKGGIN